jgi:hypothetical protein
MSIDSKGHLQSDSFSLCGKEIDHLYISGLTY